MPNIHIDLEQMLAAGGSGNIPDVSQRWTPTRILQDAAKTILPEPFTKDLVTGDGSIPNLRATNGEGWAYKVETIVGQTIYTEWVTVEIGDTEYSLLVRVNSRTLVPVEPVNAWRAWVAARIAEEATLRFNGDLANANAIAEEVSDREDADADLQNQINAIEAGNVDTVNGETGTVIAALVESEDDPGFIELEVTGS